MATNPSSDGVLRPEQREAAEKLLGVSLSQFQEIAIRVAKGGNDFIVRLSGKKSETTPAPRKDSWQVPDCFNVLSNLSAEEDKEYQAALKSPLKLARPS